MRLLFHCCCGPCAAACIESLNGEGLRPSLFWFNPNIHPFSEYQSRRDALFALAAASGLETAAAGEYGLKLFLAETCGEMEKPGRCETCYRIRLEKTAAYAAENGFDAFSTSLLISPYQQHDTIRRIGEEIAARCRVEFLYRDFRPLFRQGQAQARSLGLYMQKYCGCIFSLDERGKSKKDFSCNPLFQRLELLTGADVLEKMAHTKVLVFGLGGVGSWCAEALVRSGIGKIGLVDFDTVCESNVNRQVQATSRTLGWLKTDALKQRLLEINPRCEVTAWGKIFSKENADEFSIDKADYVIDAIDSLEHKLDLIEYCHASGVEFYSSMGMALKMDPLAITSGSIWETKGCPLARLVRQGLRKRGFSGSFTAVYSDEPAEMPDNCGTCEESPAGKKRINGSAVTVTAAAGMVLASLVLRSIMGKNGQ